MKHIESDHTVAVLANGGDLVAAITQNIIGNEVADTFNGSPLSRDLIQSLAQVSFQSSLSTYLGA